MSWSARVIACSWREAACKLDTAVLRLQNRYCPSSGAQLLLCEGADIFERGLCLPSDIKMTEEEQNRVIETVRKCFE